MSEPNYILKYSPTTFIFGSATHLERFFIEQIQKYVGDLKDRGLYLTELGDVYFNAAYNKEMSKNHQVTVEMIPAAAEMRSFGNQLGQIVDYAEGFKYAFGGHWTYTAVFTCRSMNRSAVGALGDIIALGLLKPIYDAVVKDGVDLPINNMTFDRITPEREIGFENLFRLQFRIPETRVSWRQFYDENGYIAKIVTTEITQDTE